MSVYRATISDRGRTLCGFVTWEFTELGKFIFLEDGKDQARIFDRKWWSVDRVADRTIRHEEESCACGWRPTIGDLDLARHNRLEHGANRTIGLEEQ